MSPRKLKNKWSIKGIYYRGSRQCYIDGPWRPTQDEAIAAFADFVANKHGLSNILIFRPFLAERTEKPSGQMDNRGNAYLDWEMDKAALQKQGLRIH